jgi:uncharacterized protein YodC (DUF2158 family)
MFEIGETVSVKDYGNAVIVSGPVQEPGRFFGRWQIRFSDGKEYHARPENLRRFERVRQCVNNCTSVSTCSYEPILAERPTSLSAGAANPHLNYWLVFPVLSPYTLAFAASCTCACC